MLRPLRESGRLPQVTDHWNSDKETRIKTHVVCFLYDKGEYKEELQNLRREAKHLATRDNLRIALVDNPKLVRKMKIGKYGNKLFAHVSMSSMDLRRYDGALKVLDITGGDTVQFSPWINKQSLKEVEELDNESYRVQELAR